jgi:hypothetical protein
MVRLPLELELELELVAAASWGVIVLFRTTAASCTGALYRCSLMFLLLLLLLLLLLFEDQTIPW